VTLLDDALALWRGPALADVTGEASLVAESARLDDLRIAAQEERIEGLLASGQAARAVGEAEGLLALHPLRERLWSQLMVALYRQGRQAEALGAFQRAREILADELGIDPSPELVLLQERILRQDLALDLRGEPLRGYRLMERIGEGPTGVVFRGIQPRVGRDVAVKVIHEILAADGAFVRRFEPEAQAVAALEHPHIAPVFDYWRDPAGAYIVSRYLRAGSLRAIEERGDALGADRAHRIVGQVASALAFAHRQGVTHGSIQPANVVLDAEGNAYLCDFRIGAGPSPTIEDDLEQLGALARRLLGDGTFSRDVIERLGVGEGAPGAAALADALGTGPAGMAAAPGADARNPYKGLRPFAESDRADFFGRALLVERIVARLNEAGPGSRFLAVVGPSGSGKSSATRAGVVPAIRRGALAVTGSIVVAEMFPGSKPLEELEAALLRVAARSIPRLRDRLEAGSRGLLEAVDGALPTGTEAVLIVDQFEELFTLTRDERERELFLESLRVAVADPASRLRVIVTLRADFFDRPLAYPRFGELLGSRTEAVPPLTPDELEQAIRGPAERVGVRAQPGLIAEMIADVAHQPGALPLLQYALTELFERRTDVDLTLDSYQAIGGVIGALSARAERLYAEAEPEGRRAIRHVLLRLVTLGEGREDTRRRVVRSELDALEIELGSIEAVLDAFGRHRFLTFDREPTTREPTVEIAHEALLVSWQRLRGWIDEAREDLRFERQVVQGAAEWRAAGPDSSFLLRGARLDRAIAWVDSTDLSVGQRERMFVKASTVQRELERSEEEDRRTHEAQIERRSRSRLRALVAVLTAAALIASGLTVIAVSQSRRAAREVRVATSRELAAASGAALDVDPERSMLLALQALDATRVDGLRLKEAEVALHRAVQADRLLYTIRHPSTANVDWSGDGSLLLTGGTAGGVNQTEAMLWDARSGEPVRTLSGHTADIESVAFSPDGGRAVTTAADNRAIVWDTSTGESILDLRGAGDRVLGASFSPDGRRVVWVDALEGESTLRIERIQDGSSLLSAPLTRSFCYPVFAPDGKTIAVSACDRKTGGILDAATAEILVDLGPGSVSSLAFSPDGRRVVGRTDDTGATIWDTRTGDPIVRLEGHTGVVIGTAFSPDGSMVATGASDGTARVWEASTGRPLLTLSGHGGGVVLVDFSPDGSRLLTGGADGTARVWDVRPTGGSELWSLAAGPLSDVRFSPDGSRLLVQGDDGAWSLDASNGELLSALDLKWNDASFGPGGETLAVAGDGAHLIDAETGAEIRTFGGSRLVPSIALNPDGTLVATGTGQAGPDAGKVVVWDVATGRRLDTLGGALGYLDSMEAVAFSTDGRLIAGLDSLARLRVWAVATGEEVLNVQAQTGFGSDVEFAPDGASIGTAGGDGAVVWSLAGERIATLAGGALVSAIAFGRGGRWLATAGDDETARIWDVPTGRELLSFPDHGDVVTDVAFSPDSTRLVTTSGDGILRVFALSIDDLIDLARARLTRGLTRQECLAFLHVGRCPAGTIASPLTEPSTAQPVGGPRGGFRVQVTHADLAAEGFPRSDIDDFTGDYTLSLIDGTFRLDRLGRDGPRLEGTGTYEAANGRIVFTQASRMCSRLTWSVDWSLGRRLVFTGASSELSGTCPPAAFHSWIRAVFEREPWDRITGGSAIG
jgi:WD40 repeat protein/tetratricopeptide (TPR) repeat protein